MARPFSFYHKDTFLISILQKQRLVGFFLLFAFPGGMPADGAPFITAPLAEIAVGAGILL
jgi:hypothetical protein